MTLIVFKDGVLASDTRATHRCSANHNNKCAHCDKEATSINDNKTKITLAKITDAGKFRDEKVLAIAGAGNMALIDRMKLVAFTKFGLEETYLNYLLIHGKETENPRTGTLLLVCETHNYVVRFPNKGHLEIYKHEKHELITMGSGSESADWVSKLLPHLKAPQIVNLAMHGDITVGGEIDYVDFSKEKTTIERHGKFDPQSMLDGMVNTFKRGVEALKADQKKTPRKNNNPKAPK